MADPEEPVLLSEVKRRRRAVKGPDWKGELDQTKGGQVKAILLNAVRALRGAPEWEGVVCYDEFRGRTIRRQAAPWAVHPDRNYEEYDPSQSRISPGQPGRAANILPIDPHELPMSVDDLFRESRGWFPGILILYSVDTGATYRIETGQGDSEIILVEGTDVYYRVNSSLFRTSIKAGSLDTPSLIASDPAIGNVHIAFTRR